MATTIDAKPIRASDGERVALDELEHLLRNRCDVSPMFKLVGPQGEEIEVPESVVHVLCEAVRYLQANKAVTLVPVNRELTTQQAADLLNVSRPYLIKILEEGGIPFAKVGTHRRIRLSDLMDYKQRRDAEQRVALDELTQLNEEMGLYDE